MPKPYSATADCQTFALLFGTHARTMLVSLVRKMSRIFARHKHALFTGISRTPLVCARVLRNAACCTRVDSPGSDNVAHVSRRLDLAAHSLCEEKHR